MRISDWSSDVCSSDLSTGRRLAIEAMLAREARAGVIGWTMVLEDGGAALLRYTLDLRSGGVIPHEGLLGIMLEQMVRGGQPQVEAALARRCAAGRSEERPGANKCVRYSRTRYTPQH